MARGSTTTKQEEYHRWCKELHNMCKQAYQTSTCFQEDQDQSQNTTTSWVFTLETSLQPLLTTTYSSSSKTEDITSEMPRSCSIMKPESPSAMGTSTSTLRMKLKDVWLSRITKRSMESKSFSTRRRLKISTCKPTSFSKTCQEKATSPKMNCTVSAFHLEKLSHANSKSIRTTLAEALVTFSTKRRRMPLPPLRLSTTPLSKEKKLTSLFTQRKTREKTLKNTLQISLLKTSHLNSQKIKSENSSLHLERSTVLPRRPKTLMWLSCNSRLTIKPRQLLKLWMPRSR